MVFPPVVEYSDRLLNRIRLQNLALRDQGILNSYRIKIKSEIPTSAARPPGRYGR